MMFKRILAVVLLIGLTITAAACGNEPEENNELYDLADEFIAKLEAEEYGAAVGYFDETMKGALPEETLKEVWEAVVAQTGPYKSGVDKRQEKIEGYDVVFVSSQFEKAKITIRLVFDNDKQIAGLFFE